MIPLMERELVTQQGWYTTGEFVEAIALSNAAPGLLSTKMATHAGFKMGGWLGALVSPVAVMLPSVIITLACMLLLGPLKGSPTVAALFRGLRPAVFAMLAQTLVSLFPSSLGDPRADFKPHLLCLGAFVGLAVFNQSPFVILGLSAVVGYFM